MVTNLKIFLFVFTTFLFCNYDTVAQNKRMVKSKSYQILLQKLLKHDVPEISVDSLNKIKEPVLLLDARESGEFNVSHLNNAKWVGYKTFSMDSVKNIDKSKPIIVYCSVGYRSEKITERLLAAGYTNVNNLYGGIFEWKNRKLDVYNENGITNDVHPYNSTWGMWLKNANKVYQPSNILMEKK